MEMHIIIVKDCFLLNLQRWQKSLQTFSSWWTVASVKQISSRSEPSWSDWSINSTLELLATVSDWPSTVRGQEPFNTGHLCFLKQVCKDIPGDLVFLIDSSGSIYAEDYTKMKEFMKSVIRKSIIGKNEVHVGVMQFSTVQSLEFPLNVHYSKEEMSTAIDSMKQMGGGTYTGKAIREVSHGHNRWPMCHNPRG
uniref:VWFA domain-containing protein n=1 Tax=Maylandia zebra TaxID=106582 RepID=A0A3P9C6X8_9CICH